MTFTLTGDVEGSGIGEVVTKLAPGAVNESNLSETVYNALTLYKDDGSWNELTYQIVESMYYQGKPVMLYDGYRRMHLVGYDSNVQGWLFASAVQDGKVYYASIDDRDRWTEWNEEVGPPSEWYNLKMLRVASSTSNDGVIKVLVENMNFSMVGNANYRFCLMRWKRGAKHSCMAWRVPMRSPRWNATADDGTVAHVKTGCAIEWNNCWWPVVGQTTPIFAATGDSWKDVLEVDIDTEHQRFKSSRNKKLKWGVAIFKRTGEVPWRWQRVSNIAEITLYCDNSASTSADIVVEVTG